MDKYEFIDELIRELSYRTDQGYPDFTREDHIN